jgi:hypothetical protein
MIFRQWQSPIEMPKVNPANVGQIRPELHHAHLASTLLIAL